MDHGNTRRLGVRQGEGYGIGRNARIEGWPRESGDEHLAIAARRILGDHHNKGGTRPWTDQEVDWIEANCSHIVYVAANALRVGAAGGAHEERLAHLADNIQRTSLPTLTLGLGGQAPSNFTGQVTLPDGATKLLSALGERSKSIAVRGAFTAEILNSFGV